MQSKDLIKNITSKDLELSKNTIKEIISNKDFDKYKEMCDKSDFIFPFLKERINKTFISFINNENLDITFEFAKLYNSDFEEIILTPWLKYADEDLTDKILLMFENGSDDEKIYAARYFFYINDSLALDYLNINSESENEILRTNCAKTLAKFGDTVVLNKMYEIINNSNDEFEKLNAFQFIISYHNDNKLNEIVKSALKSPFIVNIISTLRDNYSLNDLIEKLEFDVLVGIFNSTIENYPENISLNTVGYYEILDYIDYLSKHKNQYVNNSLCVAKNKFMEFADNDMYLFDLDNNLKALIKQIADVLNKYNYNFDNMPDELRTNDISRINIALDTIGILKLTQYSDTLAQMINSQNTNLTIKAKIAEILKKLNLTKLINKDDINKIEDINIKTLILSLCD